MTTLSVRQQEVTLLEVLDRLLDKGVVVAGDLTLSVAEVDLIFASLRLVVTSMDKAWEVETRPSPNRRTLGPPGDDGGQGQPASGAGHLPSSLSENPALGGAPSGLPPRAGEPGVPPEFVSPPPLPRVGEGDRGGEGLDPDKAANGLAQLVLTLAELLRKLLEREALRRMERGTVSPGEMERLGQAFSRLEERMQQLKRVFGFRDDDLNLNLGPLGKLM